MIGGSPMGAACKLVANGVPYDVSIKLFPGYDCRRGCKESDCTRPDHREFPGQYGIAGDVWTFALRRAHLGHADWGGMSFSARDARVAGVASPDLCANIRSGLILHTSFPRDVLSVQRGAKGNPCDLLPDGLCFSTEGFVHEAEALFPELKGDFPYDNTTTAIGDFNWDRFARAFEARFAEGLKEWRELPAQCPHCKGLGVVPRDSV